MTGKRMFRKNPKYNSTVECHLKQHTLSEYHKNVSSTVKHENKGELWGNIGN